MKILHTSDWHLGRSLYGRKRYREFEAFLGWLAGVLDDKMVDILLVAGDIFDTTTPTNRAQELYYDFLARAMASNCQHIVIIGGNHDSPSLLNAPDTILRRMNIHVVGGATENPEDEVITLASPDGMPQAIVCAVPYLRDRDIRRLVPGESMADKNVRLLEGIRQHYTDVCAIARKKQQKYRGSGVHVPIIGMGHLFTDRGKTVDGDGVRELYVGSLVRVGLDTFPGCIDYMALGHLHVPQFVGQSGRIRYSGSPIPMGYAEAPQDKKISLVDINGKKMQVSTLTIPRFQALERIVGDKTIIIDRFRELKAEHSKAWVEVEYTGTEVVGNLRGIIDEAVFGTDMEVRRIKNMHIFDQVLSRSNNEEMLDDLDEYEVFNRCLDANEVPGNERPGLNRTYKEIITIINERDVNAE